MTVREQLAAEVARVQAEWAGIPAIVGVVRYRYEEIVLEAIFPEFPFKAMYDSRVRVNAAETCGAAAGHLHIGGFTSKRRDVTSLGSPSNLALVTVRLLFGEVSWNSIQPGAYRTADFDALLAVLEPGAVPSPERAETWHDRPGLL